MAEDLIHNPYEALKVRDPENGSYLTVDIADPRYIEIINRLNAEVCQHSKKQMMRVPMKDGRTEVRNVCLDCGDKVGSALPQKDKSWVAQLPDFTPQPREDRKRKRQKVEAAAVLDLARTQYSERGKLTPAYQHYLMSPEWRARRELVLKRCNGVCEGCGVAPATDAHHTQYNNLGNEFLFDLLGVCRPCHQRIHANNPMLPPDMKPECE